MTKLLVSVRSVAEADTALAAGADWIDIKEPTRGALGRADDATIQAIVAHVAGRKPVSAAQGELAEAPRRPAAFTGLVKIGLAGSAALPPFVRGRERGPPFMRGGEREAFILAAYADWQVAAAPPPRQVLDFAIAQQLPAFLIDTWQKDGRTLLDWLSLEELARLGADCRRAGIPFVLAGSLSAAEIERVLPLQPDIVAVRGAACRGRDRSAQIDHDAVERLVALVHGSARKLMTLAEGKSDASRGNHMSTTPSLANLSQVAP